jgi:hypothetical protein
MAGLVPAIRVFAALRLSQDVGGRNKSGHDVERFVQSERNLLQRQTRSRSIACSSIGAPSSKNSRTKRKPTDCEQRRAEMLAGSCAVVTRSSAAKMREGDPLQEAAEQDAAKALPQTARLADKKVDADAVVHIDHIGPVRIIGVAIALDVAEWRAVTESEVNDVGRLAADRRAVFGGDLVAGDRGFLVEAPHVRLAEPARQHRDVCHQNGAEGHVAGCISCRAGH